MDIDEVEVEIEVTPAPDEQIHLSLAAHFNPFPFTHDARNAIYARRSLMSDELVFDLLLEQASIASPHSLFPPDSPETLLDLLIAIAKSPWDSLKKSCLLFYLLSYVSPNVAAEYASTWALPAQFVHLAHSCFLLDSGSPDDLAHAVSLLSDARIVQDLSSKILHTLSLAPQPASSRLVRTYVRTAQPVLETYDDLAVYLRALLECSLADAWMFQRTFAESTPLRNQLFRTILDGCLIPPKPSVLPHLLSLPLTTFEFSLLHTYALSPPEELTPAAHSILQDLITVRLLHSGKYSDAIRLSRAFDSLNPKPRAGNTPSLHKAAGERQQMMRDVLAVIPEVQRRQLELEFSDEQADGEATAPLGGSWASMGSGDVSMSWESLGVPGSANARERSRSGRLEGSPAPNFSGKPSAPNTPFGLFSSPAGSAQKRRISAHVPANIFGSPTTPVRPTTAVLPTIPTPGLDASIAARASSMTPVFRPPQRLGLGNIIPTRQPQPVLNGIIGQPASATPRSGVRFDDARNAPPRTGTSLFGGQGQGETDNIFSTPRVRRASGDGKFEESNGKRPGPDRALEGQQEPEQMQAPAAEGGTEAEDMMMVDSDDPDGFVIRGRRRTSFRPRPHTDNVTAAANGDDPGIDGGIGGNSVKDTQRVNGTATIFGRRADDMASNQSGSQASMRRKSSSPHSGDKILPGGFSSFELNEGFLAPNSRPAPQPATAQNARHRHRQRPTAASSSPPPQEEARARARASNTRSSRHTEAKADTDPRRLKIPGALFEDDGGGDGDDNDDGDGYAEDEAHAGGEEKDNVPSLSSVPSSRAGPATGRRTKRSSRTSSTAESGDDEEAPKRSLRRSSRLSSAMDSPEPLSPPQRQEKRTAPKRSSRASVAASAAEGPGRSTRKRRNVDE